MTREPIIDIHMHSVRARLTPDGDPIPNPATGKQPTITSDKECIRQTLEQMDKHNIVKGFLCGNLEEVYRWVREAPDRFMASPMISPTLTGNPNPSIEYLKKEHKEGRIQGIGEICVPYDGIPLNDPELDPYYSLAEELDLPVLVHGCGFAGNVPSFRSRCANPLLLEDVVSDHPKLSLWVENAGYPFLDDFTSLMVQHPNVYADVSTMLWMIPRRVVHDYLRRLVHVGYPGDRNHIVKRLMFGTDQFGWPDSYDIAVDTIESAEFLSEEQKRDIFYNNAKRFLGL
ncbi:MAG: amidohydrolase family protein [Candidatus Thorarchaeota archaeon]